MSCGSVLVTGANRGIGLEFVRQLVRFETPLKYVFATYRNKDTTQTLEQVRESSKHCQVVLIQMDVTKREEVQTARKLVEEYVDKKGLNLLINNAGAFRPDIYPEVSEENMNFHFNTNTLGPISIYKEMLPLLQNAANSKERVLNLSRTMVLNMTSKSGSIRNLEKDPIEYMVSRVGYKTSKAALNMAMRNFALIMSKKNQDILMVNMCPGSVKTDMAGDKGEIDVTESISSMLKTLPTLDLSRQGDFMDRHGQTIAF